MKIMSSESSNTVSGTSMSVIDEYSDDTLIFLFESSCLIPGGKGNFNIQMSWKKCLFFFFGKI